MRSPARVVHVITGLDTGGAEAMLHKLVSTMDRTRFENHVISLTDDHTIGDRIAAAGISVTYLGMARGRPSIRGCLHLVRLLRSLRPTVVQTWMYHADLLGGLAARMARVPRVVWNVRHSDLPAKGTRWSTRLTARLCAITSRWLPDRIVSNAHRSVDVHVELGYPRAAFRVIANGFDTEVFRPDPSAAARIRRELGVDDRAVLVLHVARLDPQKDHLGLIEAASRVARSHPDAQFVLAGRGVSRSDPALRDALSSCGAPSRFHLLGERHDVAALNAACDVAVSSSRFGEGFPNSVGEAMSSGVPCVVTNVGDSARIVGDTGRVVPPGDPAALAAAIESLVGAALSERRTLGSRARERAIEHFSLDAVVREYESMYDELCR